MATPPPPPGPSNRVALGGKEYSVELNDANFEAASWKNPRYDGSRTTTTVLNQYNNNDVTFGKTAATQKYTRNIYFGNAVIGLNDVPEDPRLLRIENFSYIQTNRFFTINDDDSISVQRLETTKGNFDSKNGFYRAFYEDFPLGSDCRVIVSDDSVKTSLNDRYNIYFNGGTLKKLFSARMPGAGGFGVVSVQAFDIPNYTGNDGNGHKFSFTISSGKFSSLLQFYNENDIRKFYTGSIETRFLGAGNFANYTVEDFEDEFLDPFFEYKYTSDYIGDKRLFLTITTSSQSGSSVHGNEFEAIRTVTKDNMPVGTLFNTENLAELSTIEIVNTGFQSGGSGASAFQSLGYFINPRTRFNYRPVSSPLNNLSPAGGGEPPAALVGYTKMFTLCDDVVPSLLLNLPKEEHLPDGIGRKGFVIIPENIHPHIKQNLVHYLAKAGISLGTDVVPALDNTYRKLM